MADVFVSYANEDRVIAEKIATGLIGAGLSVWWDRHIPGGVRFNAEIERQIESARAVIVLWSVASQDSDWVRDEAQLARDENKLIPIRTDAAQPPLGLRQVQSIDLRGWSGDPVDGAFEGLLASLRRLLGGGAGHLPVEDGPKLARPVRHVGRRWFVVAAATAVAVGALALALVHRPDDAESRNDVNDGRVEIEAFEPVTKTEELERLARGIGDTVARTLATEYIKTVKPVAGASDKANGPARDTGAEFALRGTVDRDGDELIVSTDVVHRREDLVLWSTTMRRALGEAQRLKVEVSISVATALRCALTLGPADKSSPSVELFARYLQYCGALAEPDRLPELARRIVETAPHSAMSYALLAVSNAVLSRTTAFHWTERPEAERDRLRTLVYENVKMALKTDPSGEAAGIANYALAIVLDPAAGLAQRETYFRNAVSLAPDNAFSYRDYALFLGDVGRIDEARGYLMRGLSVDPLQYVVMAEAAYLAAERDVKAARDQFTELKSKAGYLNNGDIRRWFEMEWLYGDPTIASQMAVATPALLVSFDDDPTKDVSGCLNAFLDARTHHVDLTVDQIEGACAKGWFGHPLLIHSYFGHVDWVFENIRNWGNNMVFYDLYPTFARTYFSPEYRAVRADPRFMPFMQEIGRLDYWLDTDQWPDFCKEEKLPYDCKQAALAARANAAH